MARLSGKLYLVVGFAVLLLSWFVNRTREDKAFALFMNVGGIFILIGIVREIWFKGKSTESHEHHLHHGTHHPGVHKAAAKARESRKAAATAKTITHKKANYCSNCGITLKPHDMFCAGCGRRVV